MELTTVWSGAHKHTYLCIHDPEPPKLRQFPVRRQRTPLPVERPRLRSHSRQWVADGILALLEEQPIWLVSELRKRLEVPSWVICGVITRLRDKRLIQQVGQIGYVKRLAS